MAVHDEYTTAPQLTYRFGKSGRYLAQVGFFANVSSQFGRIPRTSCGLPRPVGHPAAWSSRVRRHGEERLAGTSL